MGILSGAEQKEFLEKAEAERIREFYNFDKYCWGPGMCKAAQEQVKSDYITGKNHVFSLLDERSEQRGKKKKKHLKNYKKQMKNFKQQAMLLCSFRENENRIKASQSGTRIH